MNYAPVNPPADDNAEQGETMYTGGVGSSDSADCCTRCIRRLDCTLAGPWCIESLMACFAGIADCMTGCCNECCTECCKCFG